MEILTRRAVVKGLLAGVPLAAVLADPRLAAAAAAELETVALTTQGGRKVAAALGRPAQTPAPAVLLVHEWWGLNNQIKAMAAEVAQLGYVALAVDLYDGKVAATADEAGRLAGAVDPVAATDTLVSWLAWLKRDAGVSGRLATLGWCFGGGWSLSASLAHPVDATVIYYGRCTQTAAQLAPLKGPGTGAFRHQGPLHQPTDGQGFRNGDEGGRQKPHRLLV